MSRKEERGVRKWEASIDVKKGNEKTCREKKEPLCLALWCINFLRWDY